MAIEREKNPVPRLWGQKKGKGVEGDDVTGPQPARDEKPAQPKGK